MSWLRKHQQKVQGAISVLCLVVAFSLIDPQNLGATFETASPLMLAIVLGLVPTEVFIRAWRWRYLLECKQVHVSNAAITRLTLIGRALNLVLPASLGDVARSYYGWREGSNKEAMLASALADKVVALFALCLLGTACAAALGLLELAIASFLLTIGSGAALFVPKFIPWNFASVILMRFTGKQLDIQKLHFVFKMDMTTLVWSVILSLAGWIVTTLIYYFACLTFQADVSLGYMFAIAPLINVVRVLPVSISGLGSADLLLVVLLGAVGVGESVVITASMLVNLALIILPGIVGVLFILGHKRHHSRPIIESVAS